jgi:oxygen-independent coproporphyrinogen-3 oxidase
MLGIYIHIPYCLQRCTYCDFATYERSQILPPEEYIDLVKEEMRQKFSISSYRNKVLQTIYFGGGTPSLIPAELIVSLLNEFEKYGLKRSLYAEITVEINPATVDEEKLKIYLKNGVNRFSVGAQTFDDFLLKSVHREHNSNQTRQTLQLLKDHRLNFSFDLLFALPGQTLQILEKDLAEILNFNPQHISPYCLTVPEGHVLAKTKPLEDVQVEMFSTINKFLISAGYIRYEISNYSKRGYESRHNQLYWNDSEYIGLGLSAHSYLKSKSWGVRFWNASTIGGYQKQVLSQKTNGFDEPFDSLPSQQIEILSKSQSLTDFCHIFLRTEDGLNLSLLESKFGSEVRSRVENILCSLGDRDWLNSKGSRWKLTDEGMLLSNQVFAQLTFLDGEISE